MSLSSLNTQAVACLQGGRLDEGVSLLLEAFDQMDLLAANDGGSEEEEESMEHSDSTSSNNSSSQRRSSIGSMQSYAKRAPSPRAASSEPGRYQTAISRATEAHVRLAQSRSSLERADSMSDPGLASIGSDLSELSDGTSEFNDAAVLPSRSDVSEANSASVSAASPEESVASTFISPSSLHSIALPEFHESSPEEEAVLPVSDNIFTFYQRAFVLTSKGGEEEEDTKTACPKQSAVLLYNMAVAHHNYAMSSTRQDRVASHKEFRTALVFYDMCFNIIQHSWSDDEDFLLLLLAVWNNMGHIHAHSYNYLKTQEMLTSLQEILQVISSSRLMENADFLFFYKNLVVYEEQEFAAAPAA